MDVLCELETVLAAVWRRFWARVSDKQRGGPLFGAWAGALSTPGFEISKALRRACTVHPSLKGGCAS